MCFGLRFSCWASSKVKPQGEFAACAASDNLADEDVRLNDVGTNVGNGNVPPQADSNRFRFQVF